MIKRHLLICDVVTVEESRKTVEWIPHQQVEMYRPLGLLDSLPVCEEDLCQELVSPSLDQP